MSDQDLVELLSGVDGDEPSPHFVASLRTLIDDELAGHSPSVDDAILITLVNDQTPNKEQRMDTKKLWITGLAGAAAVLAVLGLVVVTDNDAEPESQAQPQSTQSGGGVAEDTSRVPTQVIEAYEDAYNSGDVDAVMSLFSDESVITAHPSFSVRSGLERIRDLQTDDIAAAAASAPYTFSNVEQTGDTVRWDHVWIRADGEEFCGTGHSAIVVHGKILSWTFADIESCS